MQKSLKFKGKTVEQATQNAILETGLSNEELEIEVIEEGSKGLFGLGNKEAEIQVTFESDDFEEEYEEDDIEETDSDEKQEVYDFLSKLFEKIGNSVKIDVKEKENTLCVDITGNGVEPVIGRKGETLDSIQYLTNLAVGGRDKDFKHIVVDVEGYRKRKEKSLVELAERTAHKVSNYRESISLEPMNGYERMIIHSTLQDNEYVETHSEGEDPYRKVVITVKK